MGDDILILAFVIIVIGGIGSIKGAFVAAMVVGQIDIVGRAFLPDLLKTFLSAAGRLERRARDLAGADLCRHGGRAGVAADRPVRAARVSERLLCAAARARHRAAAGRPGRPAAADAGLRPALPAVDRHAHRHLVDRRGQPQPDPGLWRPGELRPRRLLRHRRLCRRHPVGITASPSGWVQWPVAHRRRRRCGPRWSARCRCARAASTSS